MSSQLLHELRAWAILADVILQLNLSRVVLYCISLIIAKIQAFDAAAFVAELFLVYCSCYDNRSAILDSNNWYQSLG
jgi:hypothetical protein